MQCLKCHGLMVFQVEPLARERQMKCLNCGRVICCGTVPEADPERPVPAIVRHSKAHALRPGQPSTWGGRRRRLPVPLSKMSEEDRLAYTRERALAYYHRTHPNAKRYTREVTT